MGPSTSTSERRAAAGAPPQPQPAPPLPSPLPAGATPSDGCVFESLPDTRFVEDASIARRCALTERIKERALALGFVRVGITRAEPLEESAGHLADWLALGRHATMRYMERGGAARRDPRELLPDALSIISVAANYYVPDEVAPARGASSDGCVFDKASIGERLEDASIARRPDARDEGGTQSGAAPRGKISRYARGRDYHTVLRERLSALLAEIIEMAPGARGRVASDAIPLLEKAIAEKAGIGWIGKHTNLITRTHGSWIFLGEILVTIPLAYDEPFAFDLCGSCVRCIEACPTGAIVAPRELDSARCISYATIEHRGEIPESFGGKMDGWLFGCDVCQEVCPWNRFAQETAIADFAPRPEIAGMTLDEAARLTDDEFRERMAGSAITRTRAEGIRRNARYLLEEQR
jgi:epoxyqueuosine reductase